MSEIEREEGIIGCRRDREKEKGEIQKPGREGRGEREVSCSKFHVHRVRSIRSYTFRCNVSIGSSPLRSCVVSFQLRHLTQRKRESRFLFSNRQLILFLQPLIISIRIRIPLSSTSNTYTSGPDNSTHILPTPTPTATRTPTSM